MHLLTDADRTIRRCRELLDSIYGRLGDAERDACRDVLRWAEERHALLDTVVRLRVREAKLLAEVAQLRRLIRLPTGKGTHSG